MPISLYDISVPVFIRGLTSLSHVLKKAEEYAKEKGLKETEFTEARIIDDMKAFCFQVQTTSNTAKNALVRVAGIEAVPMEDNETTFAQLQERISKTLDILKKVEKTAFDGTEEKEVVLSFPGRELKFTGTSYLLTFAIPNFFFHVTTAYDILRSKGVPIGKNDFLNGGQQ